MLTSNAAVQSIGLQTPNADCRNSEGSVASAVNQIYDLPALITMAPIIDLPLASLSLFREGYIMFGVFDRINKYRRGPQFVVVLMRKLAGSRIVIKHVLLDDPLAVGRRCSESATPAPREPQTAQIRRLGGGSRWNLATDRGLRSDLGKCVSALADWGVRCGGPPAAPLSGR